MARARSGGGATLSKNVSPPVRTGSPRKGTSPAAADQLGQAVAFKREQVEMGKAYNASILGNAKALDVGKGAPGAGRTVMPCGSQGVHGPVNRGEPRQPGTADRGPRSILNEPKG